MAVTKEFHNRDLLIDLLWEEYDWSTARTRLRKTLYLLRKSLIDCWLESDRQFIGLKFDDTISVDVGKFYDCIATSSLQEMATSRYSMECLSQLANAVMLYRGDFLGGYSLKDSQNFEEWRFFQAETLRCKFNDVLIKLINGYIFHEDYDLAIHYAKRWLSLDLLNEQAHCKLMQLYDWKGQRAAVIQQYEECAKILYKELGITPQAETIALYKGIISGRGVQPEVKPENKQQHFTILENIETAQNKTTFLSHKFRVGEHGRSIFVAREQELQQLSSFVNNAFIGNGKAVFITGGAGQGKTELINEFARRSLEYKSNLLFSVGNCNAYTGLGDPYLPFREILGRLTVDFDLLRSMGVFSQLLAESLKKSFPFTVKALMEFGPDLINTFISGELLLKRAIDLLDTKGSKHKELLNKLEKLVSLKANFPRDTNYQQSALFEQYSRVMIALSCDWPLLLFLDDLQWADIGSISLLFHFGRRLLNNPILLIGAYRPEDVAFERYQKKKSIEMVVNEFKRAQGENTIDLFRTENRMFVDAYIDSEPNHLNNHFRETLFNQTGGNPLFTSELLREMVNKDALVKDSEGFWVEGKALEWKHLPTRVEAVIAERIQRLDVFSKELLKIACVEGEVFNAEVVSRVIKANPWEVIQHLSSILERKHRLIRAQEIQQHGVQRLSRYRFHHILFQNYLYNDLDPVERAYLHEAVGNNLEQLHGNNTEEIALQLAWHFQESGQFEKAAIYMYHAGQKAMRSSANDVAIEHFRKALDLLVQMPHTPERDQREIEFYIGLGVPLILIRGHADPEVERTYIKAKKLVEQHGNAIQNFHVLHGLRRFHLFRGELVKAKELSEQLLSLAKVSQDNNYLARAFMMQGETQYRMGEFTLGLESSNRGIELSDPDFNQFHILNFGNETGIGCRIFKVLILWHLGYPAQALKAAEEMIILANKLEHPFTLVFGLCFVSGLFQLCSRGQTLSEWVNRLIKISNYQGFALYQAWGTFLNGWVLSEQGEGQTGINIMKQGLNTWLEMGIRLLLPNFLYYLAVAQFKAKKYYEGVSITDQALSIISETNETTFEAELHRLKGEFLWRGFNEIELAETCFKKAIKISRLQSAKSWELRSATSLCLLWTQQGKFNTAYNLLDGVYSWFTEGFDTQDLKAAENLLLEIKSQKPLHVIQSDHP
ncbi:MAG: AAA family ATPase [Anaerolineales bacterium]|nr:AAA family ATPase [Anaerolineales bacterium]